MQRATILALCVALWTVPTVSATASDAEDPTERLVEESFVVEELDDALTDVDHAGELAPAHETDTRAFETVRYEQRVDGIPVHGAFASEHRPHEADWTVSHYALAPAAMSPGSSFELAEDEAVDRVLDALDATLVPDLEPQAEQVWWPGEDSLRAAFEVRLASMDPVGSWTVVVDAADGEVLDRTNLDPGFAEHPDPAAAQTPATEVDAPGLEAPAPAVDGGADERGINVTAHPFQVNPIVGLQEAGFRDNPAGIDDGSFEDARQQVGFDGVYQRDRLQTEHVRIQDALTVPTGQQELDFRRDDPRFVELMTAYYTDLALEEMEALGYEDFFDYEQVHSVTRAPSPLPNAFATSLAGQGYNVFFYKAPAASTGGFGGFASLAEDGEVVVHELAHLFHFAFAPGVSGDWYGAFAEGTADYYASVILEAESGGFGDPCVGEWATTYFDAAGSDVPQHGDLVCIRVLDNNLTYPDDMAGDPDDPGSGHYNGQFWSGAQWEIRQEIGRNESLVLVTEALQAMPENLDSIEDLVAATVTADCALTNCTRVDTIEGAFEEKEIPIPELDLEGLDETPVDEELNATETDDGEDASGVPGPGVAGALASIALAVALGVRSRR